MQETPWKVPFPQVYQRVRQIPLARNLPTAQWMFLAMESGFINSNDYLPWAQKYYELAVINSEFFTKGFNPKIYQKYKDESTAWGPQALPLFEWDDVLFVGCVDPHAVPSQLKFNCRPLLASYENLTKAWELAFYDKPNPGFNLIIEAPVSQSPIPPPLIADPFLAPPQITPILMNPPIDSISPHTPVLETPEAPSTIPLPSLQPSLEIKPKESVLSENQTLEEMISNQTNLESHELIEAYQKDSLSSEPIEFPEGFNINTHQNSSSTLNNSMEEPFVESFKIAPQSLEKPHFENPNLNNSSIHNNSLLADFSKLSTAPPSLIFKSESNISNDTKNDISNEKSQSKSISQIYLNSAHNKMELEEELKTSFAKAYQNYRNLMILKLEGKYLYPLRWDPSYKNIKDPYPISLENPSIFRIAIRTKKPFHGPISINEVNHQFLQHWFSDHKPNFITLIPLFFNQTCVGILLGASDEPLDRKDSLHLMENTAQKVQINFGSQLAS